MFPFPGIKVNDIDKVILYSMVAVAFSSEEECSPIF
jgi:hypothetical protein